jgi:hypothetical protein
MTIDDAIAALDQARPDARWWVSEQVNSLKYTVDSRGRFEIVMIARQQKSRSWDGPELEALVAQVKSELASTTPTANPT